MTKPGAGKESGEGAVVAEARFNVGDIEEGEEATVRDAGADEAVVEAASVLLAFKLCLRVAQQLWLGWEGRDGEDEENCRHL